MIHPVGNDKIYKTLALALEANTLVIIMTAITEQAICAKPFSYPQDSWKPCLLPENQKAGRN